MALKTKTANWTAEKKPAAGRLKKMAGKKKTKKAGKPKNPEVAVSGSNAADVIALVEAIQKQKDLTGEIKDLKAELVDFADKERADYCRENYKYFTTVKLCAPDGRAVSITIKNAYSAMDAEEREEAIKEIMAFIRDNQNVYEALQVDPSQESQLEAAATTLFDERFEESTAISFNKDSLSNSAIIAKIEELIEEHPWLEELLEVNQSWTPTATFHEGRTMDGDEATLANVLLNRRLLRPHSPSFKVAQSD